MKLEDAYRAYVARQRAAQVTDSTLENIEDCVGKFVENCGDIDLEEVAETAVDAWFVYRRDERGNAHGTLAKHKTAIRSFFNWCLAQNWLTGNPADVLLKNEHAYSYKPVHSRPAPREDVDTLAAALPAFAARRDHHFNDVRDALLVSLAIDCGNRRGEIGRVRRKDLERSLANGRLLATGRTVYRLAAMGKTGEATVQFYDETAVFARLLLRLLPEGAAYIFVNGRTGKLLHEDSLRDAFKRACKFAGVPRFAFQATRKRTVRDAIVLTGDQKAGQLIAGHKDIRTTQIHYNDMDQDDVDEVGAIVANARRGEPDNLATDFFRKAKK